MNGALPEMGNGTGWLSLVRALPGQCAVTSWRPREPDPVPWGPRRAPRLGRGDGLHRHLLMGRMIDHLVRHHLRGESARR